MRAFNGLLKKDFYISRFWFFTWLIMMMLIMAASVILANRIGDPTVSIGFIIMLMIFHLAFIPLMVFSSLRIEGKTQIWLYNPQSSKLLILSKMAVSIIYQLLSQVILVIFTSVILHSMADRLNGITLTLMDLVLINLAVMLIGLYLTFWIIFYWSIYHSLGKYPAIRKIRWIAIILVLFVCNSFEMLLLKIKSFKNLLHEWTFPLPLNHSFDYSQQGWSTQIELVDVAVVPIILYVIVAIILFLISSWLLDRKVEV